jgi:cardiolipin synthase (CMP-forming)
VDPGIEQVDRRWPVRIWRGLDYLWWLPLGTRPAAVAELQNMLDRHDEFIFDWKNDPKNNQPMPTRTLAWLAAREVGKDLLVAFQQLRRLGSDSKSAYKVLDPVMVFLLLPALFLLTGMELGGGPGFGVGGMLFGALWVVLAQRVRASALPHSSMRDTSSAVWTLPNVITLSRLLALGFFPFVLLGGQHLQATMFLGAMASTDWADGFVARHYQAESRLGTILDPVADRLMMLVVVTSMMAQGYLPPLLGGLVLLRELLTIAFGVTLFRPKHHHGPRAVVGLAGKVGFATVTLSLVLLLTASRRAPMPVHFLGYFVLLVGVGLSFYALVDYVLVATGFKSLPPKAQLNTL